MAEQKQYVDRPPRIQPVLPNDEIDVPAPPGKEQSGLQAIRSALLPMVTIIGYVIVSATGQGRNLLLIIPMGLAVVISSIFAISEWRKERKEHEEKVADYIQMLAELRHDMIAAHDQQRTFYRHNYPDVDTTMTIDGSNEGSQAGSRLWERRSGDDDFSAIRLGVGALPSTVTYTASTNEEEGELDLFKDAQKLALDSKIVHDVPITVPMMHLRTDRDSPNTEIHARHTIGIAGNPDEIYPFVRAMVTHFVAFHAPTDAQLQLVGINRAEPHWDWAKDLPHFPPQHQHFPICFEPASGKNVDKEQDAVSLFWKQVRTTLDQRVMRMQDKEGGDVQLPFLLVIVDMLDPVRNQNHWLSDSSLHDLESEAAVSLIMNRGLELGAGVIFLVPERRKVPSGCQAVIEIENGDFHYAEVGVNTTRYAGVHDVVTDLSRLRSFVQKLTRWEVRRSYGEDIPRSMTLLDLFRAETISDLNIVENWQESVKKENAEWMEGALGIMSGNEVRRLFYSADRDGVHGMIAGSTGSGKSELLMTQILGLCIKYDPSIINFVLIDYKGGAAFVPFENLPHCVDIVTNLEGAAVDRMFAAINAELNRRQEINTRENVKHIVHYREKGYHLDEVRKKNQPYPHLFVIIDEFAEMMAGNSEYREQLNSITRLGRALGVTLILAAQRPTGVTDQMRANIKFRISLRVETREESNEMLRRPDAAYLPPGVPGRGYLQIGNENIEMIQVAWSGADYTSDDVVYDSGAGAQDVEASIQRLKERNVIWIDRLDQPQAEAPKTFEVLVSTMASIAREYSYPQFKPWPSPLPTYVGLADPIPEPDYVHPEDLRYLQNQLTAEGENLTFNPAVAKWISGEKDQWDVVDWREEAMQAVVGLVDDPSNAQQRILKLDLRRGHVALFGASGWGKTTFLRTVALSLAATHSPEDMHIYVLDFGGRNLEVLRDLPHVGAIITPDEEERLDRLLRQLDTMLEERKQLLSQAQTTSVYNYNANPDNRKLPTVLVMIDNFAEFKENFETRLPILSSLVREGLSNGVHFVLTGEQTGNLPGRLYSLFTERLTLKLADSGEYGAIVGRIPGLADVQGRGYISIENRPLEFQTALPVALTDQEMQAGLDETKRLADLIGDMYDAWNDNWSDPALRPLSIDTLRTFVTLRNILEEWADEIPEHPVAALGIADDNLEPAWISLQQQPHFVLSGGQLSGKTSALRGWILSLALHHSPENVGIILIDPQGYLANYAGGNHTLRDIPHVLAVGSEQEHIEDIVNHLQYEYQTLTPEEMKSRELFVFIDNYDDFRELKPNLPALNSLTRSRPGRPPIHFIACGTPVGIRTSDEFLKRVTMTRFGAAIDKDSAEQPPLNGKTPRSLREVELPLGRGFIVKSGKTSMLQFAALHSQDENLEEVLDEWVETILDKYPNQQATWIPIEETDADADANGASEPTTDRNGKRATAETQGPPDISSLYSTDEIKEIKAKLKETGFPADMLDLMEDEGIIEIAQSNGLIEVRELETT